MGQKANFVLLGSSPYKHERRTCQNDRSNQSESGRNSLRNSLRWGGETIDWISTTSFEWKTYKS